MSETPSKRVFDLRHSHATLMLVSGVHPKVVQERLGHSSVAITLDMYSHVLPGLQEAAVRRLDELLDFKLDQIENVGKMSAEGDATDSEPGGNRTLDTRIKSPLLYP